MADKTSVRKRAKRCSCICTLKTAYMKQTSKKTFNVEIETKRGVAKATKSKNQATKPPDINAMISGRPSKKEHRADALALRADERRDKLRKALGRSKYPSIQGCLNGETHLSRPQVSMRQSITHGREPGELKHLSSRRRRKKTRFPK